MTASTAAGAEAGPGEARAAFRLDWFDWICLLATALLSMTVLGPLLLSGHDPSGADGLYPVDQLQYLTWIRQASQHWLIGNEFDLVADNRVFLHPGFLLSGLAHRWFGVPLLASYAAIWKPVSIIVVFAGAFAYTRRLLPGTWPRRIGLLLAIFAVPPWSAFVKWIDGAAGRDVISKPTNFALDFISGEMWPGQYLEGYAMTAIATFMVPLLLLGLERARAGARWGLLAVCAGGSLLVTWLQPWQGAELLMIVAAVELWRWWRRGERPWLGFLPVFVAGVLPAVYYFLLSHRDDAWRLAGEANASDQNPLWAWPLWAVVLTLLPLGLPALFAFRGRDLSWQELAVRFWPFAILVTYFSPLGTFPFHSVQGLSVPLAVLAVQGLTTFRPRRVPEARAIWVVPALFLMTVPGSIHKTWNSVDSIDRMAYPWYLQPGEREALRFIERNPAPGAVVADDFGGLLIPPFTGREVYLGPFSWTPDYLKKLVRVRWLFDGVSDPVGSRLFLRSTGARFIFRQCTPEGRVGRSLVGQIGDDLESVHRFGCSTVYVLRSTPESRRLSTQIDGEQR